VVLFLAAASGLAQSIDLPKPSPPSPGPPPPAPAPVPPPTAPRPDLVISAFQTNHEKVPVGDTNFIVDATIRNIDVGPAVGTSVTFTFPANIDIVQPAPSSRFRTPCTRAADGRVTCSEKTSPSPPPLLYGQTTIVSFVLRATAPGPITISATVDAADRIDESRETNNGGSVSLQAIERPSLGITASGPVKATRGQDFSVTCPVTNIGTVPVSGVSVKILVLSIDEARNREPHDVTVKGTPPRSLTYFPTCSPAAPVTAPIHELTCNINSIPVGGSIGPGVTINARDAFPVTVQCTVSLSFENSLNDNTSAVTVPVE
jgi:hypothetical protein